MRGTGPVAPGVRRARVGTCVLLDAPVRRGQSVGGRVRRSSGRALRVGGGIAFGRVGSGSVPFAGPDFAFRLAGPGVILCSRTTLVGLLSGVGPEPAGLLS